MNDHSERAKRLASVLAEHEVWEHPGWYDGNRPELRSHTIQTAIGTSSDTSLPEWRALYDAIREVESGSVMGASDRCAICGESPAYMFSVGDRAYFLCGCVAHNRPNAQIWHASGFVEAKTRDDVIRAIIRARKLVRGAKAKPETERKCGANCDAAYCHGRRDVHGCPGYHKPHNPVREWGERGPTMPSKNQHLAWVGWVGRVRDGEIHAEMADRRCPTCARYAICDLRSAKPCDDWRPWPPEAAKARADAKEQAQKAVGDWARRLVFNPHPAQARAVFRDTRSRTGCAWRHGNGMACAVCSGWRQARTWLATPHPTTPSAWVDFVRYAAPLTRDAGGNWPWSWTPGTKVEPVSGNPRGDGFLRDLWRKEEAETEGRRRMPSTPAERRAARAGDYLCRDGRWRSEAEIENALRERVADRIRLFWPRVLPLEDGMARHLADELIREVRR